LQSVIIYFGSMDARGQIIWQTCKDANHRHSSPQRDLSNFLRPYPDFGDPLHPDFRAFLRPDFCGDLLFDFQLTTVWDEVRFQIAFPSHKLMARTVTITFPEVHT